MAQETLGTTSRRRQAGVGEIAVYVSWLPWRGHVVRRRWAPPPIFARRRALAATTASLAADGARFVPDTLATPEGRLRGDDTVMVLAGDIYQASDGGRVHAEASARFALRSCPPCLRVMLDEGLIGHVGADLTRQIRAAIANAIGRRTAHEAIAGQAAIGKECLDRLRPTLRHSPRRSADGLGLQLKALSLRIQDHDGFVRAADAKAPPDLLMRLARLRAMTTQPGGVSDPALVCRMLLALLNHDKVRMLTESNVNMIVVSGEQAGLANDAAAIKRLGPPLAGAPDTTPQPAA